MNKRRPMQWLPSDAHLVQQVDAAMIDGQLSYDQLRIGGRDED